MPTIIKTDSTKLLLNDADEHVLLAAPPKGERYVLTHVEYQNNDSIDHTPKIRIRDDSERALRENPASGDDETEYTPLTPTGRIVDSGGGILELVAPIYTLKNVEGAIESLVVQDSVGPTDEDNPSVVKCQWLVERD